MTKPIVIAAFCCGDTGWTYFTKESPTIGYEHDLMIKHESHQWWKHEPTVKIDEITTSDELYGCNDIEWFKEMYVPLTWAQYNRTKGFWSEMLNDSVAPAQELIKLLPPTPHYMIQMEISADNWADIKEYNTYREAKERIWAANRAQGHGNFLSDELGMRIKHILQQPYPTNKETHD